MCFVSAPSRPSTTVIAWSATSAIFILVIAVISILLWHRRAKNKGNMEDLSYDKLNWTNHKVTFRTLQIVRNSFCDIAVLLLYYHHKTIEEIKVRYKIYIFLTAALLVSCICSVVLSIVQ